MFPEAHVRDAIDIVLGWGLSDHALSGAVMAYAQARPGRIAD
jgi:hypothetical protein